MSRRQGMGGPILLALTKTESRSGYSIWIIIGDSIHSDRFWYSVIQLIQCSSGNDMLELHIGRSVVY